LFCHKQWQISALTANATSHFLVGEARGTELRSCGDVEKSSGVCQARNEGRAQGEGKYLLEHCATLSYGQTLGLLLENHNAKPARPSKSLRVVVGESVPVYELILPRIQEMYGSACLEERPTSWSQLMASISVQPAFDTLFACHGKFDAEDLDGSDLMLTQDPAKGRVQFSKVFAELDLRECRSVIMGACESGLARSRVGAEYLGLPTAMLSSGAQYVVGSLWQLPQLATAVLMTKYVELLKDESVGICDGLCRVQREVQKMTKEDVSSWFRHILPLGPNLDLVLNEIDSRGEYPFSHPYEWAGLHVVGDV
jgi:hypothetical protein